jgi:microcystin degradation protein MlrC
VLASCKAAMPVDGVVLGLHGAMVADGYDDCEGDLIERVRGIVGRRCRSVSNSTRIAT